MLRNAEFTERPVQFRLEQHDNNEVVLVLHDNIHEGTNVEGEQCWYADIYYLTLQGTDNLHDRIANNFDAFLAKAKKKDEEESTVEPSVTIDDLTEAVIDQEYRICLLEMGVEDL